LRRYLGDEVIGQVIKTLGLVGFVEGQEFRRSLNNNRYSQSHWAY